MQFDEAPDYAKCHAWFSDIFSTERFEDDGQFDWCIRLVFLCLFEGGKGKKQTNKQTKNKQPSIGTRERKKTP